MPFTPINVTNGSTPVNATWGNLVQTQFAQALTSINADLVAAGFVLSGYTAAKDGTVANQLDVGAGRAYLVQSDGNNDLGLVAHSASTQTTSVANSTYYLDLNPDGTWSWGTAHSAVANHLTICTVTTDGSGNISGVTDTRPTVVTFLSGMAGGLTIGGYLQINGAPSGTGNTLQIGYYAAGNRAQYWTAQSGAAQWHEFVTWNGSTTKVPLGIGNSAAGIAQAWFGDSGNFGAIGGQTTAGNFGAPVIVAQALNVAVPTTGVHTILAFLPSAVGLYRISGYAQENNGSATTLTFSVQFQDPNAGGTSTEYFSWSTTSTPAYLNALSVGAGGNLLSPPPIVIYANTGTNIGVQWNNSAGTPNDHISVIIERLA